MNVQDMKTAVIDGSADFGQVATVLREKSAAEEAEYRVTVRVVRRLWHVVFWCVIFCALAITALVGGNGSPLLGMVAAYFAILAAASLYTTLTLRSISKTAIKEPEAYNSTNGDFEYNAVTIEGLFDYYWAIDKRNDRVSTTITIAGTIMGISTVLLVIAVVALFAMGMV